MQISSVICKTQKKKKDKKLKTKTKHIHIFYSQLCIIKSTNSTFSLFLPPPQCFECLRFLYTSCFVGSYLYEGMELGLADISFLALKTRSVTEAFPLPCVAC